MERSEEDDVVALWTLLEATGHVCVAVGTVAEHRLCGANRVLDKGNLMHLLVLLGSIIVILAWELVVIGHLNFVAAINGTCCADAATVSVSEVAHYLLACSERVSRSLDHALH